MRAVWRDEVPYGFVSTPGGSLHLRTLQAERLVPHLEHLWRTDPRARELWAASTTTISDAWQYLQHHIEGTPRPADLSPAKQAWLDSQLGLERKGSESPLFAPELNPKLADFVGNHRVDQVSGLKLSGDGLQFSPRQTEAWRLKKEIFQRNFYEANPELDGQVKVHHAIEQQVINLYPGMFSEAELHELKNLRDIPNELNNTLHLSIIRREWNEFYRSNLTPTKKQLHQKKREIDSKYGHLFLPSR